MHKWPQEMPTPRHETIRNTIEQGQRLSAEDGLFLVTSDYPEALFALADQKRQRLVGSTVHYASTLFIHPTNLCELSCSFCSFYAKPGWEKAWFLTPDQILDKIQSYPKELLHEIHIVGGLWRECNLDYYLELFTKIKAYEPSLHIKAMTAVEYDFLAKLHNCSIETVFTKLMEAGLGSIPGGGAEILDEKVRQKLAGQKIDGQTYLNIHQTAHELGLHSNVTMLYGSIEGWESILIHLEKVQQLQDRTGGFRTFIPLKYHTENNALGKRTQRIRPKDPRLVYSLARLMLEDMHLKVLWNYVGMDMARELLHCGCNDLGSTSLEEKIIRMAGGVEVRMDREAMERIIREEGREPLLMHSGQTPKIPSSLCPAPA